MKAKIFTFLFCISSFFIFSQNIYASCFDYKNNSENYYSQYNSYFNQYIWASSKDSNKASYYSESQRYYDLYKDEDINYSNCRINISKIFNQWLDAFNNKKYQTAISYFHQYLSESWDTTDVNYGIAKSNLVLSYLNNANTFFLKEDYINTKSNLLEVLSLDAGNYFANYRLWFCFYELNELNNSLFYFQAAYNVWTTKSEIDNAKKMIEIVNSGIDEQSLKLNAPSKDSLSYLQYYLKDLNIHSAWKKVSNPKLVTVAIIDNWISINHPDLIWNIWINPTSEYGANKVIDFVWDDLKANIPAGDHWTMVAWIIGANTDNNEGWAWIAKKVKLMPLRVFWLDWKARPDSIIKAIQYAIDNWANIINLSLWQEQFVYSKWFDEIIKKAYDKWIIVVIAWWNWDILTDEKTWVNLNINPIAPVCNNKGSSYSFWVFATDKDGYRTNWTNYWECTPFFAPGEWIVSSSVPIFNSQYGDNYSKEDWTSFSAPIVSGIIALWYNKYWKISPWVVFDTLKISTTLNKSKQPVLDAEKYLSNLQAYFDKQISSKAKVQLQKYKDSFSKLSNSDKKKKYQGLLKTLQTRSKKLKGDIKKETDYLIDLINKEISKL